MFDWLFNAAYRVSNALFDIDGRMHRSAIECLAYVKSHATQGDVASVLAAIDAFAETTMMMNVGETKGEVVDKLIREKKPRVMVELGAYAGYSAVRFASLQREVAGADSHYFSFEYSPQLAASVKEMVAFAGLSDQVTVITGAFADQHLAIQDKAVDIFFIDHAKPCYLPDAKLIIDSGVLRKGSLLVADNVLIPGAPEYLEFIESHAQFKTSRVESMLPVRIPLTDAISIAEFQG